MKKPNLTKLIYNIIEEKDGWMTLSEIEEVFKNKFPSRNFVKSSIRSLLLSKPDLFINYGYKSTYALAKWEHEKQNIKKGAIPDLVYEYLEKENKLKHYDDVIDYILLLRPGSNRKSILSNLRTFNKKFQFFNNCFIGIVGVEYLNDIDNLLLINNKCTLSILVYEYLNNEKEPKSINKIQEYVLQKRPYINENSLYQVLKLENTKFNRFKYRCYGIASKEYSKEWIEKMGDKKIDTIREQIYEYLKQEDIPKNITDIFNYLHNFRPKLKKEHIIGHIKLQRDIFRFFDNNFIGIKAKEYSNEWIEIKSGAIHELIYDYLDNENIPKNTTDIFNYLLNIRPYLKKKNILGSLRPQKNTFRLFKHSFIGLRSKEYSEEWIEKTKSK